MLKGHLNALLPSYIPNYLLCTSTTLTQFERLNYTFWILTLSEVFAADLGLNNRWFQREGICSVTVSRETCAGTDAELKLGVGLIGRICHRNGETFSCEGSNAHHINRYIRRMCVELDEPRPNEKTRARVDRECSLKRTVCATNG